MSRVVWGSLAEGQAWTQGFLKTLKRPAVIELIGPMGAGKTQFVKWIVEGLDPAAAVSSPTFSVCQTYPCHSGDVHHVDLFRIQSAEDLESTGFWDLFSDRSALVFVEWADKLAIGSWPKDWNVFRIEISISSSGKREVAVTQQP